jgi:hypothetical protein
VTNHVSEMIAFLLTFVFQLVVVLGFVHASGTLSMDQRRANLLVSREIVENFGLLVFLLTEQQVVKFLRQLRRRLRYYQQCLVAKGMGGAMVLLEDEVVEEDTQESVAEMPEPPVDLDDLLSMAPQYAEIPLGNEDDGNRQQQAPEEVAPVKVATSTDVLQTVRVSIPRLDDTDVTVYIPLPDPSVTPSIRSLLARDTLPIQHTSMPEITETEETEAFNMTPAVPFGPLVHSATSVVPAQPAQPVPSAPRQTPGSRRRTTRKTRDTTATTTTATAAAAAAI